MKKSYYFVSTAFLVLLLGLSVSFQSIAQSPTSVTQLFFMTTTNGNLAQDRNGNPIDMSSGTTQHLAPNAGTAGNATNILWPSGFPFSFPTGTAFAPILSWSVATNGCIGLSNTTTSGITAGNNVSGGTGIRLAAFGTGLNNGAITANGKVHSKVFGTSPNQVFVVEFLGMRFTNTSTTDDLHYQVRFYENGNILEYVYGSMALGAGSTTTCKVGVSTATGTHNTVQVSSHSASITANYSNTYNTVGPLADFASTSTTRRVYTFSPTNLLPHVYDSSTVLQVTGDAPQGGSNVAILRYDVFTSGGANPMSTTGITFNTTGTTAAANLTAAKIYYTGTSSSFSTATQFGSTVNNPSGTHTVTGSQVLSSGTNYFWLVYDISGTAPVNNVIDGQITSATIGGTARTPLVTDPSGNRTIRAPLAGTVTVGTGGTYATLNALFADLNAVGLSGNLTVNIVSDITEPAAAGLSQWTEVGAGNYTVTIRPSGGARRISGSITNSGVIVLVGADRVIIDGRINNTGNNLTIENTLASGTSVGILLAGTTEASGGCNDVTIRNCTIMAGTTVGTTTSTAAIWAQGLGAPNNNLTITENIIKRSYRGIYIGTNAPLTPYLGLTITNNEVGTANSTEQNTFRGIQVGYSRGAVINGNTVYNQITTLGVSIAAIELATGADSCIVSNNKIHTIANPSASGWGAYGINVAAGNNHFIYNNDVSNIYTCNYSATSTTFNAFGIRLAAGTGIRVINNTVNMSGNYPTNANTVASSAAFCVTAVGITGLTVRNNNFSNRITSAATGNKGMYAYWLPDAYPFATAINSFANNNLDIGSEPYHLTAKLGTTHGTTVYASLADWKTVSSRDTTSVAINPAFLSATTGVPNSLALNNLGTPEPGITTDINGVTRNATTPDLGAYEFTPIATDATAVELIVKPNSAGCFEPNEPVKAVIRNSGAAVLNFANNNMTVTVNVSAPGGPVVLTATRNTGTLAIGDTLQILMSPTVNMTAAGTYTFSGNVNVTGDGVAQNNNFAQITRQALREPLPFGQGFENVSGTNPPVGWSFIPALGTLTQGSPWLNWQIGPGGHGETGNGLYTNLYSSVTSSEFAMPVVGPILANSSFSFRYRIINYSGYPATATPIVAADSITILISTNCGLTYTQVYRIDASNHVVSTNWASVSIPLTNYVGQDIKIKVQNKWGAGDYFIDFDNIMIGRPMSPVTLIAPANNALLNISGIGSTTINASWTRASSDPVTYTWLLSDTSKNFAAPLASFSSNNNGLDSVLTLNYYQIDALMASLGIPVGTTALATWTVRINAGGLTIWAVDTFDIRLNRAGLAPLRLAVAPAASGTSSTGTRGPTGLVAQTVLRVAGIVTQAELLAAGIDSGTVMQSMAIRNIASANVAVRGMFRLYIRNAPDTTSLYTRGLPWTGAINGLMLIHQDTLTLRSTAGLLTASFNQPFVYTGGALDYAFEWHAAAPFATTGATYAANTAIPGSSAAAQGTTAPANLTNTANTQFRPEMTWGVERKANDLEVNNIWALGRNPRIYGSPETITGFVKNNSFQTVTNATISLNISGANTGTTTANVTLAPDSTALLAFPFNAANTGFTNISVVAPADQLNANNSRTWLQQVTDSIFSYADTVTVGNGSVGFNTGSGLLLNKYRINGTRQIRAARIRIANNAATVGNSVYAVVTNDTGTIIAQSAPITIATADLNTWVIFPFTVAPNITDTTFMIGLAQPANATGYFPVAFQAENPTRPNAYFSANLGGGGAGAVAGFRLMIEAHVGAVAIPDTLSAFNLLTPANNDSINVDGAPTTAVNFTWQSSVRSTTGAVTYDMTLETTSSNPVAILTRTGLTSPNVSINYGVLADTLTSRGVAVGNSFTGRWKVVANSGTLSKEATAKFNIKLRRGEITSIEETELSKSIKLYPNPANTVATLDFKGALSSKMDVVIVNSMGQEMLRTEVLPATTGEVTIDVSALQQGMYFVRITDGNELAVKRLMIQR